MTAVLGLGPTSVPSPMFPIALLPPALGSSSRSCGRACQPGLRQGQDRCRSGRLHGSCVAPPVLGEPSSALIILFSREDTTLFFMFIIIGSFALFLLGQMEFVTRLIIKHRQTRRKEAL